MSRNKSSDDEVVVNPVEVCQNVFGDFNKFQDYFIGMKFGGLPSGTHPSPSAISKIRHLENWPVNYRLLRHMSSICWFCQNKELLKDCRCSLKSMVGECNGLFLEATGEDSRLKAEINKRRR